MSIPKRHHYIPRMLLKRFVDEGGFLYVFDSRYPEKGIWKTKPENVFVERHLYTQIEADGSKDASVETKFLASIESDASPVLEKIVCGARRGFLPCLTPAEKYIWFRFFYCQLIRVPERREKHSEEVRQIVLTEIEVISRLGLFTDDELAILDDDETMDRHRRNASIRSVTTKSERVLEVLSEKRICAAVIRNPKPKRSFVIASNPVLKLTYPDRAHLSDPTVEFWLPLARDVAFSPCPGDRDKVVSLKDRHIESLNKSAFEQSNVIAGCSREIIESVLGKGER